MDVLDFTRGASGLTLHVKEAQGLKRSYNVVLHGPIGFGMRCCNPKGTCGLEHST